MTSTLGTQPPPPPVQSELSGPVSQQASGVISQQMTATGESGTPAPPAPSPLPSDLQTTQAGTSTGANNPNAGVSAALTQTIAQAISLGLDQQPTNAAGWAALADKYATSAGQNAVTVAEQQAPTSTSGTAANSQVDTSGGIQFAGGAGSQAGWASMVLQEAKLPSTQNNIENMIRWMTAEEPTNDWNHANNPLNINAGGSGFDTFPDLATSAKRTAQVLQQGNMSGIYQALAANAMPGAFSAAVVASPWAASHYGGDPNHIAQIGVDPSTLNGLSTVDPAAQTLAQHQGAASSNVVQIAQTQLGVAYQWGGEAPGKAFDCSGLVQWVYGQAGDKLPRTAQEQYDATPKVGSIAQLQPGDLLFFGSGTNGIEHVGIYVGNGQMIDAPHTGADVRTEQVFNAQGQPTWANFVGATRPGDPSGATTPAAGSAAQQGLANSQQQFGQILQSVTAQLAQLNGQYPGIFATTQAVVP